MVTEAEAHELINQGWSAGIDSIVQSAEQHGFAQSRELSTHLQDTKDELIGQMQQMYSGQYYKHTLDMHEGWAISEWQIQKQRGTIHGTYSIGCCDKLSSNFSIECIDKYREQVPRDYKTQNSKRWSKRG